MVAIELVGADIHTLTSKNGRLVLPYSADLMLACQTLYKQDNDSALQIDFLQAFNSEKGIIFANVQNVYFFSSAQNLAYACACRRVRSFSHFNSVKDKTPSVLIGFEYSSVSEVSASKVLHEIKACTVSVR